MSDRWLAIINPSAGGIKQGYFGRHFLRKLSSIATDIVNTDAPGNARILAARAASHSGLIGIGGDGTIAEILNGMDRSRQRLAVIPAGTGNCLARDLGIIDFERALFAIREGTPVSIDLMEARITRASSANQIYWMASTAGVGYAAEVARLAKRYFSKLRGHAYSAAAPLIRPKWDDYRISFDNLPSKKFCLTGLLINNTRHIGKARPFPLANMTDGMLELLAFRTGWLRQNVHNFGLITGIRLPVQPKPRQFTTINLRKDIPMVAMLDGELLEGVTGIEIECRPKAVTCMSLP